MDIFFTKPSPRLDRYDLHEKAVSAVDAVVTDDTAFCIEFPSGPNHIQVEVVIDIPDKFYNPDNNKIRIKFDPEDLTAENVAKTFGKKRSTALFLNDKWYSRINKRRREEALQNEIINGTTAPWVW